MSATFTLNFFRSGIQFGSWGSFQLPGLLNFGEFKVRFILFPRISLLTQENCCQVKYQREVSRRVGTACGGAFLMLRARRGQDASAGPAPRGAAASPPISGFSALSLPVLTGTVVFLSPSPTPSLSALTLIKNVISGQLWIWVSSS